MIAAEVHCAPNCIRIGGVGPGEGIRGMLWIHSRRESNVDFVCTFCQYEEVSKTAPDSSSPWSESRLLYSLLCIVPWPGRAAILSLVERELLIISCR